MPSRGGTGSEDVDDAVARAGSAFAGLLAGGWSPPLPGRGRTAERWRAFADLGAADLPLARLAEGHADAVAVLAELGGPAPAPGQRLGVWAADPPRARVTARRVDGGWRLDGRKAWCSGARCLTSALVTAHADDGRRLFLVDLAAAGIAVDPSVWAGPGMRASDTADVVLDGVPALPVGSPEAYLERPGFWHGGIGVAAVWAGGARRLRDRVVSAAASRAPDVLSALAAGTVDVALTAAESALEAAAAQVDADPADPAAARLRALRVRAVVARAAEEVLAAAGHALGAGPLAHDAEHAAHVADLTVYLRQHHAERDVAALGELLRDDAG